MRTRISSISVIAVVVAVGLVIGSVPAWAQLEARQATYEMRIHWQLTNNDKGVEIVDIAEKASGDFTMFRDPARRLKAHAKLLAPGTLEIRLKSVPLVVEEKGPFSIVALGTQVEGGQGSVSHVAETTARTFEFGLTRQLVAFDTIVIQFAPSGSEEGESTVTYSCETCPGGSSGTETATCWTRI